MPECGAHATAPTRPGRGVQSLVSLLVLGLVVARAVNVLA